MIAIVDQRVSISMKKALAELGFSVIPLPPFSRLSKPVASHPDMLIFPFEDRLFVHKSYYKEAKGVIDEIVSASGLSLALAETDISPAYPNDVALNLFCVGKSLIGKIVVLPKEVLEYARSKGYRVINTKQGYAKCSSIVLGENAVITADPSIEEAATMAGSEVLRISEGGVLLPPYPYGFLGGASGCTKDTVYFCGDIEKHPDAEKISAFCQKNGYRAVSLSREPLTDMGSILFL